MFSVPVRLHSAAISILWAISELTTRSLRASVTGLRIRSLREAVSGLRAISRLASLARLGGTITGLALLAWLGRTITGLEAGAEPDSRARLDGTRLAGLGGTITRPAPLGPGVPASLRALTALSHASRSSEAGICPKRAV